MKRFIILIIFSVSSCFAAYQYELAVCAIFQNEARFLKEWVEYHEFIGFQKIFLYSNYSVDNYQEILEPYIESGLVELVEWNYPNENVRAQQTAYTDCLNKVRGKIKWVAFSDLDEFWVPVAHDNVQDVLKDYEDCGGVSANWLLFGTSNIDCVPEGQLLIESLIMRAPLDHEWSKFVKTIVRPERVKVASTHAPRKFVHGYFQVNTDKVKFQGPIAQSVRDNKLIVHHYWTGDENYFNTVKLPRLKNRKHLVNKIFPQDPVAWAENLAREMNTQEDLRMYRFIEPLKSFMAK